MDFFLYEIVARLVAVYIGIDCGNKFWKGLVERKIELFDSDFLFNWGTWIFDRDAMPARYWIVMALQIFTLAACLIVALFGWWRPNT